MFLPETLFYLIPEAIFIPNQSVLASSSHFSTKKRVLSTNTVFYMIPK